MFNGRVSWVAGGTWLTLACMAGVRKGGGRELGREPATQARLTSVSWVACMLWTTIV